MLNDPANTAYGNLEQKEQGFYTNTILPIITLSEEKKRQVLLTKEEASKAYDMGDYFRIPADNRDLNYEKYLELGSPNISLSEEYNSCNTRILSVEEIKSKLLEIDFVRQELEKWRNSIGWNF